MTKPNILVTGFKPFLGAETNPSEILATKMASNFSDVETLILPVEFGNAFEILKEKLQGQAFHHVLMLGVASGRKKIGFEKIGLNWLQTEQPDEAGVHPKSGPIFQGQPLALMSKVMIDEIYRILKKEGHPIEVSFSAGTFVCNDLYFRVLSSFPTLKTVFVHVPNVQEIEMSQQQLTISRIIEELKGSGI